MGAEQTLSPKAATSRDELVQSFAQAAKSPVEAAFSSSSELMHTSTQILDVLCRYRMHAGAKESRADEGCLKHLAVIYAHVKVCPYPTLPVLPFFFFFVVLLDADLCVSP